MHLNQSFTENLDGFRWNLLIRGKMLLIGVRLKGLHGDGEDGFIMVVTTLLIGCGKLQSKDNIE